MLQEGVKCCSSRSLLPRGTDVLEASERRHVARRMGRISPFRQKTYLTQNTLGGLVQIVANCTSRYSRSMFSHGTRWHLGSHLLAQSLA